MRLSLIALRDYVHREPKQAIVRIAIAAGVSACLLVGVWYLFPQWRQYEIRPLGISVELPTEPVPVPNPYEAKATVYEANVRAAAVLLASFAAVPGETSTRPELVRRAMSYISDLPEVRDLRYEVNSQMVGRRTVWHVSAVLTRSGVPSRGAGVFFGDDRRTVQVLCLFSDPRGGRTADRILRSIVAE